MASAAAMATPDASSSRHRHSRHHREERRDDHGSTSSSSRPTLPEYEPLSAPLNAAGQRALAALLQSSSYRHLKTHLQQAADKLTETAGEVNERATDARVRYEQQKQRKRAEKNGNNNRSKAVKEEDDDDEENNEEEEEDSEDGNKKAHSDNEDEEDDDEDNEEATRLARLEERVKEVTERLEVQMRQVVDAEVKLDGLKNVVEELGKEADATGGVAAARRRADGGGGRRRSRRHRHGDEDEEMMDVDEDDDYENESDQDYEASPQRRNRHAELQPPSQKLEEKLAENNAQWQRLSLTQRYTTNNAYIGFYRMVHEAKHPGDDMPPVPHASTWFAHLEDPNSTAAAAAADGTTSPQPRRTRRQANRERSASPANSDEIAIERERISLKCPLTLLPFTDPVTSTKCPHSFERQAIEDMINRSSMTVPAEPDPRGGARGAPATRARRVRCVQCPVCTVTLTLNDLKRDPVLLRRVRRAEAAQQREAEDDDFDRATGRRRHTKGGRKSGITVASDDDEDEVEIEREERVSIKREPSHYNDEEESEDE
ncbi:hypothetical protein VTN77DRAFT_3726 [Rasamsonia byssochlamydoides]|uniref:uncharacterized protein n=1 Tax=Rasamsonia byssochlamydoides TaxID=89139 RepID=UPI0037449E42